jgi:hypothetical protein
MTGATTDRANELAIRRIVDGQPYLIDIRRADEVIADLAPDDVLHAGPPLAPGDAHCSALRGAIAGTLVVEGRAADLGFAEELARPGRLRLRSASEVNACCTFGGVITGATPVFVVENRASGIRAFAAINEGRGAALRYGSTAQETLQRVRWLHGEFADVLGTAIRSVGAIDTFALMSQALAMGDELHSRQKAASALFLAAVAPAICESARTPASASSILAFLAKNDFFFLPLAMASAKCMMAAAEGVDDSSIVTAIAFNGAKCGIRVSGLSDWCTAPVPRINGHYFEGFDERAAGPVIGDSEIMETMGLGALAMANAPTLAKFLGGRSTFGIDLTREMYETTVTEHPLFRVPCLDDRGTPLAIDVRQVAATRISPAFNTGIAHVDAGIGQIGAGYGRVPIECFDEAAKQLAATKH